MSAFGGMSVFSRDVTVIIFTSRITIAVGTGIYVPNFEKFDGFGNSGLRKTNTLMEQSITQVRSMYIPRRKFVLEDDKSDHYLSLIAPVLVRFLFFVAEYAYII